MKCEQCGKNTPKVLKRIAVRIGKNIIYLDVCSECFDKAV